MNSIPNTDLTEDQLKALDSIKTSRVILPIIIGILIAALLIWKQFDLKEFEKIHWGLYTFFWVILGIGLLIIRHLAYSLRLYLLSNKAFSYIKCIELIFIWEFSSCVAPTNVGGSAVALVVLSLEKLSTAKTASIVIYTVILDSIFFLANIPILLALVGPTMLRPELKTIFEFNGWAYSFWIFYMFKIIYTSLFFYGLFINPHGFKSLLNKITNLSFLKKWKEKANKLGDDFIISSREIKYQSPIFHLKAFGITSIAWVCKFMFLAFLINGIVTTTSLDFFNQLHLFARIQSMYLIMAFSPTPGGSGFAEAVFPGFMHDFVPYGICIVVALLWRLLAYNSYMLLGLIIIPNWMRKILSKHKILK